MKSPVVLAFPGLMFGLVCLQLVCGELSRGQHRTIQLASVVSPRAEFKDDLGSVNRLVVYDRVVGEDSLSSPERGRADYDVSRQVRDEAGQHILPLRTNKPSLNSVGQVDGSGAKADFPCPVAAAIAPCVCSSDAANNIDLDCSLVESEEQLANVFQQEFPVKELRDFMILNNNAIKVLGNILNGISFRSVYFSSSNYTLQEISDYFLLESKDSLTSMTILNTQLTSDHFPFAVLAVMEKLLIIDIRISDITWIPQILAPKISTIYFNEGKTEFLESGTFTIHAESLGIDMVENNISTVEPGCFYWADANSISSNEALDVNLSANLLESLGAGTFVLRDGYMVVWLANNERLTSIAPGTFVMPPTTDFFSLRLSLYNTHRETFDEDVFGEVMPYVTDLRLQMNPLLCGCDIAWLVTNVAYMTVIDESATCADGTYLHDLDPELYAANC